MYQLGEKECNILFRQWWTTQSRKWLFFEFNQHQNEAMSAPHFCTPSTHDSHPNVLELSQKCFGMTWKALKYLI